MSFESISRRRALLGAAGLAAVLAVPAAFTVQRANAALSGTGSFPVVRQGHLGMNVQIIQAILNIAVDGTFGPATNTAVVNFQRSKGLTADGIVGPATWGQLLSQVQQGSTGAAVRGVQVRFKLTRDGAFGPATKAAVVDFQRSVGLTADGIVGSATWGRMLGAAGGSSGTNPKNLYRNGYLPDSALTYVGFGRGEWRLSNYCINDFKRLNAAFKARFGVNIPITNSADTTYRTYAQQQYLYDRYINHGGALAAYPGTSNHGWGLAFDASIGGYGSTMYAWLNANAPSYGFDDRVQGESWHWEYTR